MDLRTMAISRLMLDNVQYIKAYWIMLSIETAQTAPAYGADDIDGTVRHELIYHDVSVTAPQCLSVDSIKQLIIEAGRDPIERNTIYEEVVRDESDFTKWSAGKLGTRFGSLRAISAYLPKGSLYSSKRPKR